MPEIADRYAPVARFWRGKRVFVTGHTGFKGSWMVVWLANLGAEVRGYALAPDTIPNMFTALKLSALCDNVTADIRDRTRLQRALREFDPDIAIHMAAQPLVRRSYRQPAETFEVNVLGTANFLEACRGARSLRAAVVVTSDKCYANDERSRPFSEDDAVGGHDPYSASKAAAELVTHAYRASFCASGGLGVASARAGNVFGGGDWSEDRLIPDAIRAFSVGTPLIVRNPDATRPWQHVAAPLHGYLSLAMALCENKDRFATAFNFGPPHSQVFSVREVVDCAAGAWGKSVEWVDGSRQSAPHEARALVLDSSRARTVLGWTPRDNIKIAMGATVEWYRSFYGGADPEALRRLSCEQIAELAQNDAASVGVLANV